MCSTIRNIDLEDFSEMCLYFLEALCMDNVLKDYPAFEGMPKKLSELNILLRYEEGIACVAEIFVRAIAHNRSFDPDVEKLQVYDGLR
jgi:hypothetical protein